MCDYVIVIEIYMQTSVDFIRQKLGEWQAMDMTHILVGLIDERLVVDSWSIKIDYNDFG